MAEAKKQVVLMKGIGVSSGIVVGKVYLLERGIPEPAHFCYLDMAEVEREVDRFKAALRESRDQMLRIKKKMEDDQRGKEHIRIIDAHLMILKDNMLINDTVKLIREERVNAEWALNKVLGDLMEFFARMDDQYLRERGSDVEHIVNRVLLNLSGRKHESISELKTQAIVVAHDITPADTEQMDKAMVLGFLTDVGGRTSHSAIMARSLEMPAVVGLESITRRAETGDTIIVDGATGTVIINPSDSVMEVYRKRREKFESYGRALFHYKDMPCETKDGRRVRLMGNMELSEELDSLIEHGAEGIGLYRTEYLYMNRKGLPSEDEQVKAYKHVVKRMSPNPVIIRTLDVGADKVAAGMDAVKETNPAMGLRAIRFCLKNAGIFKTQLRAILRASAHGRIKIMFPMISGVEELRQAKAALAEAKAELKAERIAFDDKIETGAMIEVPSAAVIADLIVKETDFVSIGTNDLMQYSLAIDRVNEHVAYLYEPFHPAVLRTIKAVAEAANKAGVSCGVCGEMAGEPAYAFILVGFGVDQLSMNAFSVLRVKRLIRSIGYNEAKRICKAISGLATASEVEAYISAKMPELYKEEF
ncbi:MAG: phosphoenolpyruvate--protein phosphotransferase [Deltaproteobacteria bacterium]|nr:phosphoenolpyruvate--protein phosphotransferase [Deltaproteobacteria bacterium]